MKPIQLFGKGTYSRSVNASAQTLVNMIVEQTDEGSLVAYSTPGLVDWVDIGANPIRGVYTIDDDTIYLVHDNTFYSVNNAGVLTSLGTLSSSSGRVEMSHNTTQIIIVDGSTIGYIYTIASGVFAAIADADYPGADTVAFNNGRFIVNKPDTGQYWISASYNGTSWGGADFATAESSPDALIRVVVDHGEVILFGDRTTEFAVDTGGLDFPYTRVSGATMEWGLAARWSVAKFDSSLIWLAKNRMGEVQVTKLVGYQPVKISTPDIDAIINAYSTVTDATAFSYLLNGHPIYQINFPTADESWIYDGLSGLWSKKQFGESGRDLAEMSVTLTSTVYVTECNYGKIYRYDSNAYTDNGTPIYSEITCKHISANGDRVAIAAIQVDCETGTGFADGTDDEPQIMLQVSKDHGHTWATERFAGLGVLGNYKCRARFNRLGIARDWLFKIKITDNVKRVIRGIWVS